MTAFASPAPVFATEAVCPICGTAKKIKRFKTLFNVKVCVRCRNKFANRRQLAYIIDSVLLQVLSFFVGLAIGGLAAGPRGMTPQQQDFLDWLLLAIGWLVMPLIFAFKDGFNGYSPGKRLMGVRAVDQITQEPIGFAQSFKRNVVLIIPLLPLFVAFQLIAGRRLGDKFAGTRVVWDRYRHRVPFEPTGRMCRQCGYDLTGNVSGRCPECGLETHIQTAQAVPVCPAVIGRGGS